MSWREILGDGRPPNQRKTFAKIAEKGAVPPGEGVFADFANETRWSPEFDDEELDRLLAPGVDVWAGHPGADWVYRFKAVHGRWPQAVAENPLAVGRLHRIPPATLALMPDERLRQRLAAARERLGLLLAAGYDGGTPEVRGLQAEVSWIGRNRPDVDGDSWGAA